jgi:hypothetical protein
MDRFSAFRLLPAAVAVVTACSGTPATRHTEASYFQPSTVAEIAAHAPLRVEARVVSAGEIVHIPVEPGGSPDPVTGERSDAAAQVFAYELARITVLRVLGVSRTAGVTAGDTLVVGVPVLDPGYSEPGDTWDGVTKPGETFGGTTGQTGVFFLADVRPLGGSGQGRPVMGYAQYTTPTSATVRAVFGPLRGREVPRREVTDAATG